MATAAIIILLLSLAAPSLISCSWPSDFLCCVWLLHFLWAHAHNSQGSQMSTENPIVVLYGFLIYTTNDYVHCVCIKTTVFFAGSVEKRLERIFLRVLQEKGTPSQTKKSKVSDANSSSLCNTSTRSSHLPKTFKWGTMLITSWCNKIP